MNSNAQLWERLKAKESSQEDEQILKEVLNELKRLGYTENSAFYLKDVCQMIMTAILSERKKREAIRVRV